MQTSKSPFFEARVSKLRSFLTENQAVLLSQPHDITYFSGFEVLVPEEREAFLVVSKHKTVLQHASFSPNDVPLPCKKESGCYPEALARTLSQLAKTENIQQLLIDESSLFVHEYKALRELELTLSKLDRAQVWSVRMQKDELETPLLRTAGQIAAEAFNQVVGTEGELLQPGLTEKDVALKLERAMRELGAFGPAFPTIVAFKESGALPHYQPQAAKLELDQAVLIDFGALYQGYRSDMTRSFWFGPNKPSKFAQIEAIVKDAYNKSLDLLSQADSYSDLMAKDLDSAARTYIKNQGYSREFIHTTGHGLGLDIHEQPSLNWQNETKLQPNMAVTIEPGIYIQGAFGYRHENTFLLGKSGPENLTQLAS